MDKPIKAMSVKELEVEYERWDNKIKNATSWGAALAAAAEFRDDIARELRLRKTENNMIRPKRKSIKLESHKYIVTLVIESNASITYKRLGEMIKELLKDTFLTVRIRDVDQK